MARIKIYAKPQYLYRYRPLAKVAEREVAALTGGFIFCPAYSDMNDPMEGAHGMSARFLGSPASEKSQERVLAARAKMGIASMSEVHDHEPMWAHYAGSFHGMCVQYSLSRLLKGLDDDVAITRMMYSENQPVLFNDASTSIDRARLSLSSKTVRWSSEREWRIFLTEKGEAHYSDPKTVTKIFLGARISSHDEKLVRDAGAKLGVPVLKMVIDAYAMAFKLPARSPAKAGAAP